jgi:hypothetical protein
MVSSLVVGLLLDVFGVLLDGAISRSVSADKMTVSAGTSLPFLVVIV